MSEDFGNYRLAEKLGGGSLGEVFRALPLNKSKQEAVALKRLVRAQLESEEYAAVFSNEARVSKLMRHDRLLGAIDSGDVDGWPYLTMKLAPGGSLADKLAEGTGLEASLLASFAQDLCQAIQAAHTIGYTHSDLGPGNILFTDGVALLVDFSAATPLGQPQSGPLGTYAYMSPEQVRGEALDERSDIFSAAVLLWQCVTGERIFWRDAQHLCFMAVVEAELPAMAPEHTKVEAALARALAKKASERVSSVQDFCDSFVAALS